MNYDQLSSKAEEYNLLVGDSYLSFTKSGVEFRLYKPSKSAFEKKPFVVPFPKKQFVVVALKEGVFQNAMFVGNNKQATKEFLDFNIKSLKKHYSDYINGLSVSDIKTLRTQVNEMKEAELAELELRHLQLVSMVQSKYRNKISFLDKALDNCLLNQDLNSDSYYRYRLDGFMDSPSYGTFSSVKKAHSKRNIPHIGCIIIKVDGDAETVFAVWDTEKRQWNLKG